jgi:hypothetical protein
MAGPQATLYTTPGAFVFNVPAERSLVYVTMNGAGAGGNASESSPFGSGGGGNGAGEMCFRVPCVVMPGGTVNGSVGAGGAPGTGAEGRGATGGDSVFGRLRCAGAPWGGVQATFKESGAGGGPNNGGTNVNNAIGRADGTRWWAGSSGGNHSSGSNPLRIGGPSGGRYGAAANASSDRGGGPGSSTVFADGVPGANPATAGSSGSLGAGSGGGGGGGYAPGGTGGNGYVLIEHL